MKIYLVGGAVRDQLLGRQVTERDYVVVGATPEAMLAQGFKPVGKDFPVFLHPETHEEYALARTERKISQGYKGFAFYTSPAVTLEEDLIRRDLTINAMAQDLETGEIIDPFAGQQDIKLKKLRHVSAAFAEDPVRILRLARFAARFADFTLDPETLQLMRQMVVAGEVNALVAERVWQELERALGETSPVRFFIVLQECGALAVLFPELAKRPSATVFLEKVATSLSDGLSRFAALFYQASAEEVIKLAERYRLPIEYRDLALLVARQSANYLRLWMMKSEEILQLFESTDAFRRPERFSKFLAVCAAVSDGEEKINAGVQAALKAAAEISVTPLIERGLTGKAIAEGLRELRKEVIEKRIANQH